MGCFTVAFSACDLSGAVDTRDRSNDLCLLSWKYKLVFQQSLVGTAAFSNAGCPYVSYVLVLFFWKK